MPWLLLLHPTLRQGEARLMCMKRPRLKNMRPETRRIKTGKGHSDKCLASAWQAVPFTLKMGNTGWGVVLGNWERAKHFQ